MPRGGPDGGDGGHGGDVVLVCDPSRRDLGALTGSKHFRARKGRHGEGSNRQGARGEELEIPVPPGTQGTTVDGGTLDLVDPGQRAVVAHGGRGGHGNKRFATLDPPGPPLRRAGHRRRSGLDRAAPQAARRRRPDRPAQRRQVLAARPADTGGAEGRRLPLHDDLPGPRRGRKRRPPGRARRHSGADRGSGRGRRARPRVPRPHRALRDARPPRRPRPAGGRARGQPRRGPGRARPPTGRGWTGCRSWSCSRRATCSRPTTSAWRSGSGGRGSATARSACSRSPRPPARASTSCARRSSPSCRRRRPPAFPAAPAGAPAEFEVEHRVYRPAGEGGYSVEREDDGGFRVLGRGVELLFERHDLKNEEALGYLESRLNEIGVISALRAAGFEAGDDVRVGEHEFELHI